MHVARQRRHRGLTRTIPHPPHHCTRSIDPDAGGCSVVAGGRAALIAGGVGREETGRAIAITNCLLVDRQPAHEAITTRHVTVPATLAAMYSYSID